MLKKKLRLDYHNLRNQLSKQELEDRSLKISNNLIPLSIWHHSFYHVFLSIASKREIDTGYILSILQGKDKNIVIPKMSSNNSLAHFLLTDNTTIIINKWDVPEPIDGLEVPTDKIDVVFVPLLAFDVYGNRVGYGKGYYDAFLRKCRKDVIKIGISMFEAVDKIEDVSPYDERLHFCVTPNKIYEF